MSPVPERRRVLDAFSCAGGMGWGLDQAGLDVTGLDIDPQPRYPFPFIQGDAITYIEKHGHEYDLVHGSPPCQRYSPLNAYNQVRSYPDLIGTFRAACQHAGVPYVIENVVAARAELIDPVLLCGYMFPGLLVERHRYFEASFPLEPPPHPPHTLRCTRNGYLPVPGAPLMSIHGGKHSRAWQRRACEVMGMPWIAVPEDAGTERIKTGIREVCEAIPPAYGQWAGEQFLRWTGD